ncbi:MAG: hypothetical protein RLO03_08585 [Balneola sp.]
MDKTKKSFPGKSPGAQNKNKISLMRSTEIRIKHSGELKMTSTNTNSNFRISFQSCPEEGHSIHLSSGEVFQLGRLHPEVMADLLMGIRLMNDVVKKPEWFSKERLEKGA